MTHLLSCFVSILSGGDPLPGQKLKPRHSGYPKGIGGEAPAWVAFDRQVRNSSVNLAKFRNFYLKCFCGLSVKKMYPDVQKMVCGRTAKTDIDL